MEESQRPGQKLINYIRFLKDCKFYLDNGEFEAADGERYLWNMSQKEFDEVMNSDWETLAKKHPGKPDYDINLIKKIARDVNDG